MALLEKEGMHVGVLISDPSTDTLEMMCSKSVEAFMDKSRIDLTRYISEANAILNKYRTEWRKQCATGCNVFFLLGERPKSAAAEKSQLLKEAQALFRQKYATFVIDSIHSTLNQKIVYMSLVL